MKYSKNVNITKNEYDILQKIENIVYRKLLFIMLVDAKYCHEYINGEYMVIMSEKEIIKCCKCKVSPEQYCDAIKYFVECEYIIIDQFSICIYIVIADDESDTVETIHDYNNLNLHFNRMQGIKVGCCKYCSSLFEQNTRNNLKYCKEHRGYQKVGLITKKCIDCGEDFTVKSTCINKLRCDLCQEEYRKSYKREIYKKNTTRN